MTSLATAALIALSVASSGAFAFYGYETLFAASPRGEYERYQLASMRVFVGRAQLLGAAGVIVGLAVAPVGLAAALGLSTMMVLGLTVRLRLRDAPRLMIPAATLALINGAVVTLHARAIF